MGYYITVPKVIGMFALHESKTKSDRLEPAIAKGSSSWGKSQGAVLKEIQLRLSIALHSSLS